MRSLIILAILVCFAPSFNLFAGENSDWPAGSAMDVGSRALNEQDRIDRSMKKALKEIRSLINEQCYWCKEDNGENYDLLKKLDINQASWRKYAESECELLYQLEGPPWNTWASTRYAGCVKGQSQNRLNQLVRVRRCLKTKNRGKDYYEFQECLYQLAPLSLQ